MQIMGLDVALTRTGVALPDGSTRLIRTREGSTEDSRLLYLRDAVRIVLTSARPDLVILEDVRGGYKGLAARQIPMVHGAVRVELMDQLVPYVQVNPSTLKAYALGKPGDKAAMIMAAYKRSGREFTDDNECDAAWLRWLGLDWAGEPEFTVPAAQRARLKTVNWAPAARLIPTVL